MIITTGVLTLAQTSVSYPFPINMEDDLYDEFGNYIGPDMNDSEEGSVSVCCFL